MIDWRLVLHRLRPASGYHWTGDGMNDSYASIGEWRDKTTTKPTEAECVAEWEKYQQEKATETAELTAMKSTVVDLAKSAVGVKLAELTAAQRNALIACLLHQAGAIDTKTLTIKPLGEWVK